MTREYVRDEDGKFASTGGSSSSEMRDAAERIKGREAAKMINAALDARRVSDARGVDQPESRRATFTSRQTRQEPPEKDRRTTGRGRAFYG